MTEFDRSRKYTDRSGDVWDFQDDGWGWTRAYSEDRYTIGADLPFAGDGPYTEIVSEPAPEIKLGTVVVDRDDDVYVCVREQDDPAFVIVREHGRRDLAATDAVTVFVFSEMSEEFGPLTVNGVPLVPPVPEFEEPVKIGTLVHDKFDAPWVRVVSGWLGAAEVREQSPVSWSELTADNGPLTLVEE